MKALSRLLKKITEKLDVTVDYTLGGSEKMVFDKKLMKRIKDMGSSGKRKKTFNKIDLVIRDVKIKKAHAA